MPRNINVPEAVEIFYGTITSNFGTYGQNLNVIKEALAYFCYWRKHSCRSNQTWSNSWRCSTQFLRVFNVPWYWSPKIERKIICHNGSWCSYSWQRIDSKNMACHGLDFRPISLHSIFEFWMSEFISNLEKNRVQNQLDFFSSLNLISNACVACKNQFRNQIDFSVF